MAQTWPLKKWKLALLGLIDSIGRPVVMAARAVGVLPTRESGAEPRKILVVELWQIGDIVLATPFLRALRGCFPSSRITLVGKPHAVELLAESGLVDEVIVAELPWTRPKRKYALTDYDWPSLGALMRTLRSRRFDLAFDARMDLRNNAFVALTGARRRVGFRYGGGDWLLTDAVPAEPRSHHKVDDWLALLGAAGCTSLTERKCLLRTSAQEQKNARWTLASRLQREGPIVAVHPGGSHAGKRWPLESFQHLCEELINRGDNVIAFEDPAGFGRELEWVAGVVIFRPSLREMMAILEECALLVCNDSGPMHVAAALGVPTVAIFERGEPRWFGPVGEEHVVLAGELAGVAVSSAPEEKAPRNPVPVSRVLEAVVAKLESRTDVKKSSAAARELY